MAIPKGEINAVIAAMTHSEVTDETTNEEMALRIIEALSAVRNLTRTYVAVSQQRLRATDDWSTFAVGPFATELQAAKAGEGMAYKSGSLGQGRWKVGVLMPSAAETWKVLAEVDRDPDNRFGWVKGYKKSLDSEEWSRPEGRGPW